jgi:regulatory protein
VAAEEAEASAEASAASVPAAEDAPLSWAELVAAEEAQAESGSGWSGAEEVPAGSAPAWGGARPKPEKAAKAKRSGGSGFGGGGLGGAGFGAKQASRKATAAKKTAAAPAARQRSHFRDRAEADGDGEAQPPKPALSREKLEQRAKNILLYHLGRQMRTRSQLAERLKKKEIPDDIAEAVLDRFQELHLLDDAQYAETFIRSRHAERGLAKRALGYELRKRGIDDDTAAEALETLDEDQEAATARRLVEGRLRATKNLDAQVRIRRLIAMLARKGYSGSLALRVVREALAQEVDDELAESLDDPDFD